MAVGSHVGVEGNEIVDILEKNSIKHEIVDNTNTTK